jgi:NAD(P)-dependent dehydrogenase (short-subunit alcohol dehydrogenase family)
MIIKLGIELELDHFKLSDRVAVVTGAGRGIGRSIALGLAGAGAHVVVAARTPSEIKDTATKIRKLDRKSLAIPTDVRLSDHVNKMVENTLEIYGKIDILVNNAGSTFVTRTMEMSEKGWDAIIRENLKSVFLCSQAIAKVMVKQKRGVIVNIASIVGLHAQPLNAAYAAAKAGVINLTKTMATDLAKYNVRVNAIAPGHIATPGSIRLYGELPEAVDQIPLSRAGAPEDIVGGVIYLASDASSYVTGETIVIDGGATIKCSITLGEYIFDRLK